MKHQPYIYMGGQLGIYLPRPPKGGIAIRENWMRWENISFELTAPASVGGIAKFYFIRLPVSFQTIRACLLWLVHGILLAFKSVTKMFTLFTLILVTITRRKAQVSILVPIIPINSKHIQISAVASDRFKCHDLDTRAWHQLNTKETQQQHLNDVD